MSKFLYILGSIFMSGVMISSCAMKDELTGKSEHYSYGDLVLNISNNAKADVESKTESEYNGNRPGVFPAEEININNYTLFVYDKDGVEQESELISELGKNGVVSLTLSEGEYTIKAYNYDAKKEIFDCKTEMLTISNSDIGSNAVYCFSKSKHNLLWIGNEEGLCYYSYKDKRIRRRCCFSESIVFAPN